MVNYMQSKIYSEVYELLRIMGEDYINKIPQELYSKISENRDKNYITKYNKDLPIYEQELDKNTIAFLCMLHYNYWCESDNEKKQIEKILNYNQNLKIIKYNQYRERFKKKNIKSRNEENQLIQIKQGIIKKITNYIRLFIKKG